MSSDAAKEMSHVFKTKTFVKSYKLAENVTGPFAEALIDQTGITSYPNPPIILDNASGTGVVCSILNTKVSEKVRQSWELTAGDFSEAMVAYATQRAKEEGWLNAEAKVVDAQDTKLPSGHYTHVFATFAFPAIPNPDAALKESFRILKPGGMIASATWKHVPWFTLVKDAIATISPDLYFPDSDDFVKATSRGWQAVSAIESLLKKEGFADVQVTSVTKSLSIPIADLVELNMSILPALLAKYWTQEQRDEYEGRVSEALQLYLEEKYGAGALVPVEPVGIIATARKPE
ncbi:S-adenosyl-L-methionine-dependent methyltransferase [Aspergillus pseudoustus]|uniref:S-adenosyl-L-methionine-dependent methyltransferase n=1 Tax=Aspergillus pseudoustus TaxID=1810923 RepID=A0ABR4IWD9_9EURO